MSWVRQIKSNTVALGEKNHDKPTTKLQHCVHFGSWNRIQVKVTRKPRRQEAKQVPSSEKMEHASCWRKHKGEEEAISEEKRSVFLRVSGDKVQLRRLETL